ncbi:Rhodanese-related sulfurtransferase [Abditibacterium utsteinense]|uniref:Rhodanese-related sulfurtransferase n=1 Tax=Abditibacterium utsteinense TaxID=1960156 RepID=A0A2S8SQ57_9BACT|nr:rhodanese-like domain-containing protein [Abditibacterium utsteinense]PQV62899.1 Rhodanese-related sulfurtransferase [Abditibacterium utsteinense]
MNRALFLLAFALPLSPRSAPILPREPQLEIVGPSVLMNRARETPIIVFDLRIQGRAVPNATRNLAAPIENATVFALGELETARKWAKKRALKSVFVVPPHLIEFEAMRNVPQITPRAAYEKVSRNHWPLFDISEAIEFDNSRLPRSRRLDYNDFRQRKLQQLPKNRPFIVACRVGHRSQLVTRKLRVWGYDARNLNGGLWQWQVDKLPLEGNRR